MDAQNAAEPATSKPSAADKRSSNDKTSDQRDARGAASKSPVTSKTSPNVRDAKASAGTRAGGAAHVAHEAADGATDAGSDAETVVLPGKEGFSPSKTRNVRHEDKNDDDRRDKASRKQANHISGRERDAEKSGEKGDRDDKTDRSEKRNSAAGATAETAASLAERKRRLLEKRDKQERGDKGLRTKDPVSSSLSSASTSPRHTSRPAAAGSDSEAEARKLKSPRDTAKSAVGGNAGTDKATSQKRKAQKAESDDEGENRKARRQRTSGASNDLSKSTRQSKDVKPATKPSVEGRPSVHARSESPHARSSHRRSVSSQLPNQSSNGLSQKKKRVPAPLHTTDYHSDDSSAGGSPYHRSTKSRHLTTPATAESAISPARMVPHRKHLDAHGQTPLAKACARGEYELAKQRLEERRDDLDFPDYAGNSPLQVAALNGKLAIVRLLIENGCNVDCMNNDKDTPLLDAVENGHVEVVRMLLNAGVNPRKANVNGEEPLDLIKDGDNNAEEIKTLLIEAKAKVGEGGLKGSEDHAADQRDAQSSLGPESPRRSPGAVAAQVLSSRRGNTVRATKTSNSQLYTALDVKTLRQAAKQGDIGTVTRVLEVLQQADDAEAMINAARGGHDVVMEMLLALGGANPDPPLLPSLPTQYGTPMLAAIGQEQTLKVIKLLLEQPNFNPTQTYKGDSYHAIAKRREGPNWRDEEQLLKEAHTLWKRQHKDAAPKELTKNKSPQRREQERESKRAAAAAAEAKERDDDSRMPRRKAAASPARDSDKRESDRRRPAGSKLSTSPKDVKTTKNRSNSFTSTPDDGASLRKGPGRPKKDDGRLPSIAISDRENSPSVTVKQSVSKKRAESDLTTVSSDGEAVKPRRKLISGKELNAREREKNRRTSMASAKESSSPRDSRQGDAGESRETKRPVHLPEKFRERAKKREQSSERASTSGVAVGEGAGSSSQATNKRLRAGASPARGASVDKEDNDAPVKRRRIDGDAAAPATETLGKKQRRALSPEERHHKPGALAREISTASGKSSRKDRGGNDDDRKEPSSSKARRSELASDKDRRDSLKIEKSIHVKSEDPDVEMIDATPSREEEAERVKQEAEERKKDVESKAKAAEAARKEEEEKKRREEEDKKRRAAEEAQRHVEESKRREEEERKRVEEEKALKQKEEMKRKAEEELKRKEEERLHKEEEERKRKAEEERKRKEEEERIRLEEEKKKREEEERLQKEKEERRLREEAAIRKREEEERIMREEEERLRKEEEERKRKEEEERLRREQEAAEEARRKREEEERKERERKERIAREEMKRRREAELRRIHEEQERLRLAKLPPLLRWLDQCPNPKTREHASLFRSIPGVRYDTINWGVASGDDPREQWVLNVHVALLLGEKDLSLSRYTAWERIPASNIAKVVLFKREPDKWALTESHLELLARQVPGAYNSPEDHERLAGLVPSMRMGQHRQEARELFLKMDLFFVKLSELLYLVPNIAHLRNVELVVHYVELPQHETDLYTVATMVPNKWIHDADGGGNCGKPPRQKYFVNGQFVRERKDGTWTGSRTPFPETVVNPRRGGLQQVFPGEKDYLQLCHEQGIVPIISDAQRKNLTNGIHIGTGGPPAVVATGDSTVGAVAINGTGPIASPAHALDSMGQRHGRLVNGTNGIPTVSSN